MSGTRGEGTLPWWDRDNGAQDDRLASSASRGWMPRWRAGSATVATFATATTSGRREAYVPLATASVAGALSAADFGKLATLQVPVLRLSVSSNTDLLNAAALTANTEADVLGNQNFTATATGIYLFLIRLAVLVTGSASAGYAATLAVVNSAGTPLTGRLSGAGYATGGNAVAGSGAFTLGPGLPAGTNTLKLQIISNVAVTAYCRCNTAPKFEFCQLQIWELCP